MTAYCRICGCTGWHWNGCPNRRNRRWYHLFAIAREARRG